ncbi:MAG: hypothetical protein WCT04_16990 [Planctomycetota bacterium]
MNRIDELTFNALDGSLTRDEQTEFNALLTSDPAATERALAIFDIEAELRADQCVDVTAAVVRQIQDAQSDRMKRAVMARIGERKSASTPITSQTRTGTNYMHWVNAGIAAAALISIVIFAFWKPAQTGVEMPPHIAHQPNDIPSPAPKASKVLFSQDFNNGLPPNWTVGIHETRDLPEGVKGAVRQPAQPVNYRYGIHSPKYDVTPLAELKRGDVVHFTFKSEKSGPVKLQLGLLVPDLRQFVSGDSIVKSEAGKWQTLDISVESFSNAKLWNENTKIMCTGYALGANDIGLVLTRFWITRNE